MSEETNKNTELGQETAETAAAEPTPELSAKAAGETSGEPEEQVEAGRNERKFRVGVVTSNSMQKSIAVYVERRIKHKMYGKYLKRSSKFIAHDENNDCNVGDKVRIEETRPLSKRKRWRLVEILERAK